MAEQQGEWQVQERVIDENRSLRDYVIPLVQGIPSSIKRSTIQSHNFEIKLAIITMI